MEGYKRLVVEIPADLKNKLDEMVEFYGISIKCYLITAIHKGYLEMLDRKEKVSVKRACTDIK